MKKGLIALMIATSITATALTGCSDGRDLAELENENKIREMLEYDANTNISKEDVKKYGFKVEYTIDSEKFYITFKSQTEVHEYRNSHLEDKAKITYEVDKDTYYNFKNNYTLEEDKVRFELRKILNKPKLKVNATCVRVPIHYCHGASVYVECEKPTDIIQFERELKLTKGIKVLNNLNKKIYPLTKTAVGTEFVYVGRIRQDLDNNKAVCFWVVADNLKKGAATNAVQILKKLIISKGRKND